MTTQRQDIVEEQEVRQQQDRVPLLELIDRSLDKGVVVEAWVCVPVLGIEVLSLEFSAFIASCETYLEYADAVRQTAHVVAIDDEHEHIPPQS